MDSLLNAAARALSAGDPLSALNRVSLREDAPALALRGVAMAQLGDHERARQLLKLAARRFGSGAPLAQARCQLAEAEVCLAVRELQSFPRGFADALQTLKSRGDTQNALHGQLLLARRSLLMGRLDTARAILDGLGLQDAAPSLRAVAALCHAEILQRRVRARDAASALKSARRFALAAKIPALLLEVQAAERQVAHPAAQLLQQGEVRSLDLSEVETLFAQDTLIVDGCRRALRRRAELVPLSRRPVLFALLECLARNPEGAKREQLILAGFGARRGNDSHRARLRVEIGRLRKLSRAYCDIEATKCGFRLIPHAGAALVLLQPPLPGDGAAIQALLADGQAWSTSALALALGESQRNVQRTLAALRKEQRVRAVGRARAQRWVAPPLVGFATTLLLPLDVADG